MSKAKKQQTKTPPEPSHDGPIPEELQRQILEARRALLATAATWLAASNKAKERKAAMQAAQDSLNELALIAVKGTGPLFDKPAAV